VDQAGGQEPGGNYLPTAQRGTRQAGVDQRRRAESYKF
jgi:hypothetical protein